MILNSLRKSPESNMSESIKANSGDCSSRCKRVSSSPCGRTPFRDPTRNSIRELSSHHSCNNRFSCSSHPLETSRKRQLLLRSKLTTDSLSKCTVPGINMMLKVRDGDSFMAQIRIVQKCCKEDMGQSKSRDRRECKNPPSDKSVLP